METPSIVELQVEIEERPAVLCTNCASPNIHRTNVRSAFWHQDRLVVVEDIPAIVCDACHEQFYDDSTVVMLDLLRGEGFPAEAACGELRVPVFSLRERFDSESES